MDSFTSYSSKEEKTPRSKGILLCLQTELNNVLACARLWRGTDFESFARSIFYSVASKRCFLSAFFLQNSFQILCTPPEYFQKLIFALDSKGTKEQENRS